MRRLVRWASISAIVASITLVGAAPASAKESAGCPNPKGCVRAVTINGFIDEINVDFIERAVAEVEEIDGYLAVVLVVDSPGSVVPAGDLQRLVDDLEDATIPVSAWVGPSGAEALGGAAELVASLPSSMSPNSRIGDVSTPTLAESVFEEFGGRIVDEKAAVKAGLVDRVDPLLGDHVLAIPDMPFKQVKDDEGRPKREIAVDGVTQKLPVTIQLLHTAASPGVAYLALGIAIGLLLLEFFTAGIGVAGVVGAICAVMSAYGLAALPVRPWALMLCVISAFAFGIDIQTAIPRVWTAIGLVSWSVGSIFLFDGFRAPWLSLATGVGGMAVTMMSGMPAMVRSRFATPTLGRDWMIGREGTAVNDIDPEGTVEVDGGEWRAITNRATPLKAGDPLRVAGIDGLTLEVEPLEGAAVDYREQRGRKRQPASDS